jgi:ABC-2 type transport system permease protein
MAMAPALALTQVRADTSHPPVGRAVAHLSAGLIRRSTLAISVGVGVIVALEAFAYQTGYPDAASRAALTMWGEDPGIRIIAGPATAVDTVGGFVVWDAGLYLTLILGAWALTMTTRVLRGDEGAGRTELLLVGPIRPVRVLLTQFLVLFGACAVVGVVVALALSLSGAAVAGAILFGMATTGYCCALVALTGLASQVFATRRGTLGTVAASLAALILVRMVANSADSRMWLGWLTPGGWTDQLRAFGDNRWPVLLVPLTVTIVLAWVAVALRMHRDAGAGLLAERAPHRSRPWGLGSPLAFAWRTNLGVLLAWAGGVAAAGVVVGVLLPTMDEYLASDAGFQDVLVAMGMNLTDLSRGFLAMWATILGLVIAVYCAFRLGATRAEEASTRADFLLTRSVPRWRWLGGHVLSMAASVVVLGLSAAAAMWLAGIATDAELSAADSFGAVFNTLPAVTVFAGLGVLVFGVVPRLTVAVAAGTAVAAYVLELVGPVLKWPEWVLGISPFHHLTAVPVDPFEPTAALVMLAVGVAFATVGVTAFTRRDLVGV